MNNIQFFSCEGGREGDSGWSLFDSINIHKPNIDGNGIEAIENDK